LTEAGRQAIAKIAAHITSRHEPPVYIFASPFLRAVQTAEFFQREWERPIETKEWLLPNIPPSSVLTELEKFGGADCALVGHLPNLGLLLGSLLWGLPPKEVVIPRGGVAHLTLESIAPATAKLRWLLTPEAIK
jgi:phosphohistidine phosphatase